MIQLPTNDKLKAFFITQLRNPKFQKDAMSLKQSHGAYQNHVDKTIRQTKAHLMGASFDFKQNIEMNHITQFIRKMSDNHILYAFGGQDNYALITWIDKDFQWVTQIAIQGADERVSHDIGYLLSMEKHAFVMTIERVHAFEGASRQQVYRDIIKEADKCHVYHYNASL